MSWRARASSCVAVLLLAVGMASCGDVAHHARSERLSPPQKPHILARLSGIQRHDFALLRRRPVGLPPYVRSLALARGAAINPAMAQRLPVLIPGSYWLVPGIGYLCVVSQVPRIPGVGTVCARTEQAIQQGVATVSFAPAEPGAAGVPKRLLVGVAPDDAREALVHTHGSVATVPVVDDVFVLRDSAQAPSDFIALRRAGGR